MRRQPLLLQAAWEIEAFIFPKESGFSSLFFLLNSPLSVRITSFPADAQPPAGNIFSFDSLGLQVCFCYAVVGLSSESEDLWTLSAWFPDSYLTSSEQQTLTNSCKHADARTPVFPKDYFDQ